MELNCQQIFCSRVGRVLLFLTFFSLNVRMTTGLKTDQSYSSGGKSFIESDAGQSSHVVESHRHRQSREHDNKNSLVQVLQFHVSSKLYFRFAKVTVNSEVMNTAEVSREIAFKVQVPEAAFMSNFTMVVAGRVYRPKVLEKEEAEKKYNQAKEKNQTAAQVKQESEKPERGMDVFTVNVNVAANSSAHFTLVYNELLERRKGIYKQRLMIEPGAIVQNMSVSASFAEQQGFKYFAYILPGSDKNLTSGSEKTNLKATPNARELVFKPTVEMQRAFHPIRGIHGGFTILYSVVDEPGGGNIIVQNDYFAHFFAPPDLDPLPKNILFIIDISGSMDGQKIQQVRVAMVKILEDLRTRASDRFNILLFNDRLEKWREEPSSTLGSEIAQARAFALEKLHSSGGTNIHLALMNGLEILLGNEREKTCGVANIIVFLTDGDPTVGVTDPSDIVKDVTAKNKGRASIYSLGFGFQLNFGFLTKISSRNRGFAHRIYAQSDAKDQLQNFYEDISRPILCDVVAHYSTDAVDTELLTITDFALFYAGREIVVAGKTRMAVSDLEAYPLDAELEGTGTSGLVKFVVMGGNVKVITDSSVENDLTEKLWSYMKIKSLLHKMDTLDSEIEKEKFRAEALNMSLTYRFVTPLTSFSIVVEESGHHSPLENEVIWADQGSVNGRQQRKYSVMMYDTASKGKACVSRCSAVTIISLLLVSSLFFQK